jgi:hypothetical protein
MAINELVDDLRRQIDPNIQHSILLRILLECLLEILFNPLNHELRSLEVMQVPLIVALAFILFTDRAIGQ